MKVLVTGANGFIGKNLLMRLREEVGIEILPITRNDNNDTLMSALSVADIIIHLAGENRPKSVDAFENVNVLFTRHICEKLITLEKLTPIIISSSTQANLDNPYGRSKKAAEKEAIELEKKNCNPIAIFNLPGVFGKWCKPNYNSVVATFCYNKAHNLPIKINDSKTQLQLVYVDDVIDSFLNLLKSSWTGIIRPKVTPKYNITLRDLSKIIDDFKNTPTTLMSARVGNGLTKALYATYLSYIPKDHFTYDLPVYKDKRGIFIEMIKTQDSGQFSFFTVLPGSTRGGHYHHSKVEKFLVIKGKAKFNFRNIINNEKYSFETEGKLPKIVMTAPGWAHEITNVGDDEMLVVIWANEIFDPSNPDTFTSKVQ